MADKAHKTPRKEKLQVQIKKAHKTPRKGKLQVQIKVAICVL